MLLRHLGRDLSDARHRPKRLAYLLSTAFADHVRHQELQLSQGSTAFCYLFALEVNAPGAYCSLKGCLEIIVCDQSVKARNLFALTRNEHRGDALNSEGQNLAHINWLNRS